MRGSGQMGKLLLGKFSVIRWNGDRREGGGVGWGGHDPGHAGDEVDSRVPGNICSLRDRCIAT